MNKFQTISLLYKSFLSYYSICKFSKVIIGDFFVLFFFLIPKLTSNVIPSRMPALFRANARNLGIDISSSDELDNFGSHPFVSYPTYAIPAVRGGVSRDRRTND